jgi:hypothetical protein
LRDRASYDPAIAGKLVRRDAQILVAANRTVVICQRAGIDGYRTTAARIVANTPGRVVERGRVQRNGTVAVDRPARIDDTRIGAIERDVVRAG